MRLIDADALENVEIPVNGYWDEPCQCYVYQPPTWMQAFEAINKAPTIDAVPVVHAYWKAIEHKSARVCSRCEKDEPYKFADDNADVFDYCPHCGARMDERRGW